MKLTLILLFTIFATAAHCQSYDSPSSATGVAMGLSAGYSSRENMIGTFSLGALLEGGNHLSLNLTMLGDLKTSDTPSIGEARIGHFFTTWELYGGAAYHVAGSDNKLASNPNTGLRPAFGIIKHFQSSPWTVSASMSGKIFSLQVGLFGVR